MGFLGALADLIRRRSKKGREITVLIADDEIQVRRAVRRLVERDARFEVVGEATDGEEAVAVASVQQPNAVLLDLAMPHTDGLSAIPKILEVSPDSKIIVLSSMVPFNDTRERALELGAYGVFSKYTSPRKLLQAVAKAVTDGE